MHHLENWSAPIMTASDSRSKTRSDLLRFLLLFSTLYVGFGLASPFFPAFLASRGIAPEQIGLLLSVSGIVRLISGPFAGRIADHMHARRVTLLICTLGSAAFAVAFVPSHAFIVLLLVAVFYAATLAPTTTLADALALRNALPEGSANQRFEYGWVRGAGSAAFVIGALLAGQILDAFPPVVALIGQAAALMAASGIALLVPEIVGREEVPAATNARAGLQILIANRPFRLLIIVAATILGSHAMHDSFAMIAWNAAGISPGLGSVLWSEQVAAEVLVFIALGPWLLDKVNPVHAMALSAAAAALRWAVMGQSSSVAALALVEPLHGLTFALLHLACMRVLVRITPAAIAATAQAIYAFGIGAASALLTYASGFLYADFGSGGFFMMSLLAAASFPAIWALSRVLRRSEATARS